MIIIYSKNHTFFFVVDNAPPTITCPSDISRQVNCGTPSTRVDFAATAFDNCGAVSIVYSSTGSTNFNQQSQSSATINIGTSRITATATDNGGRQATCTYSITVVAGKYFITVY